MGLDYGTASGEFLVLALFCLNFILFLATSTPVERLFSHGGLQVTKRRHSIAFETLRCLMVLRSWFLEGMIPEDKVMEMFRNLRSRRDLSGLDVDDN